MNLKSLSGLTGIGTGVAEDKDNIEFLCELYEAQVACGRYFVHELTSEVNSRMKCEEDHGHAVNENGSGRSVYVRVGRE